jgi:hypothetical protein
MANAACYTIFSGMAYRMIPYSILFSLPLIVDFAVTNNFLKSCHHLTRFIIIVLFSLLSIFSPFFGNNQGETAEKDEKNKVAYTTQELFTTIDNLSKEPIVIMAHTNDGPALLYYTKHSVVGAPYHRQSQGIISSFKVMEDEYNEKIVKEILKATNSSYIFIRNEQYKKSKARSLSKMIIDNAAPEWIKVIQLPVKFNDVTIAKINI